MFSTMICWPSSSDMRATSSRPTMSTLLPGPNGTIAVMCLVGHSWAAATPSCDSISTADTTRRHKLIRWLPRQWKAASGGDQSPARHAFEGARVARAILRSPGHYARPRFEQGHAQALSDVRSVSGAAHRRPSADRLAGEGRRRPYRRYHSHPLPRAQSPVRPAALITLAHFATSSAMMRPKSAGELVTGGPPRSANRAWIAVSAAAALSSWLSLSMISTEVFFGTTNPLQELAS